MKLLGIQKLASLKGESDVIDKWISSWVSELSHANWKQMDDVCDQFPTVLVVDDLVYVFSVESTGIQIKLNIAFAYGIAVIIELIRKS